MTISTAKASLGNSTRKAKTLKNMRPKILLTSGTFVALALTAGLFYIFDIPPFKGEGVIRAEDVCVSLGNRTAAASALKEILPGKSSYSFDNETTDPRTDKRDDSYENWCFIYGDGDQLLSVRSEMLEYEQVDGWVAEAVAQGGSVAGFERFTAGDKAVVSSRVAAVYVPCTSEGSSRHLSVIVRLKKHGDADASELRPSLITLAKRAATYAHEAAHCELPSKVSG
ncbi:hypothetical protein [Streptomyces prasinus]|uniref:hypothetical protein n=1 Tax=Streptomyces prasinus TaxID=67345 RepID=UPI002F403F68